MEHKVEEMGWAEDANTSRSEGDGQSIAGWVPGVNGEYKQQCSNLDTKRKISYFVNLSYDWS